MLKTIRLAIRWLLRVDALLCRRCGRLSLTEVMESQRNSALGADYVNQRGGVPIHWDIQPERWQK